jgi:hypothetical protein
VSCLLKQKWGNRTAPPLVTVTQQQPYLMAAVTPGPAIDGLKFILLVVLILIHCYIMKADYQCHTFPISTYRHTDVPVQSNIIHLFLFSFVICMKNLNGFSDEYTYKFK